MRYSTIFVAVLMLLMLPIAVGAQVEHGFGLAWWYDEAPNPPVDSFFVYQSDNPDTGFVLIGSTTEMFYVVTGLEEDHRYYFRISAVRDYIESGLTDWVSGRSIDASGGAQDPVRISEHYEGYDERVVLVAFVPNSSCYFSTWQFGLFDLIGIKCSEGAGFDPPNNGRID